jgi:hypothetical protein
MASAMLLGNRHCFFTPCGIDQLLILDVLADLKAAESSLFSEHL